jgi:hypothetical protein
LRWVRGLALLTTSAIEASEGGDRRWAVGWQCGSGAARAVGERWVAGGVRGRSRMRGGGGRQSGGSRNHDGRTAMGGGRCD